MPHLHMISIRKRAEFLRAKSGRKLRTPFVHIQLIASPEPCAPNTVRVGYTVSKHCGNAVLRNRTKRRLRHIMRALLPEMGLAGYDYVVIARAGVADIPFATLRDGIQQMLQHAQRKERAPR
jgi:ribonuclease P protein component